MPPSQRATREFFARWRNSLEQARKPVIARRDYVMGKLTYLSGVRAAELCGVCIGDVHWELGQWGRFLVYGKGAHGSGPRQREAYLFAEGRDLLWSGKPISLRLDDLDKICAALDCAVADLLKAEPLAATDSERESGKRAVGADDTAGRPVRPTPRRGAGRSPRSLPPN